MARKSTIQTSDQSQPKFEAIANQGKRNTNKRHHIEAFLSTMTLFPNPESLDIRKYLTAFILILLSIYHFLIQNPATISLNGHKNCSNNFLSNKIGQSPLNNLLNKNFS